MAQCLKSGFDAFTEGGSCSAPSLDHSDHIESRLRPGEPAQDPFGGEAPHASRAAKGGHDVFVCRVRYGTQSYVLGTTPLGGLTQRCGFHFAGQVGTVLAEAELLLRAIREAGDRE